MMVAISQAIILGYVVYSLWVCRRIPSSLSETFYYLQERGQGWLFSAALVSASITLFPHWVEVSSEETQFFVFLSCIGLAFVGTAPQFKIRWDGRLHECCALLAAFSAIAWIVANGFYIALIAQAIVVGAVGLLTNRWLYWLELGVIGSIYFCMFEL